MQMRRRQTAEPRRAGAEETLLVTGWQAHVDAGGERARALLHQRRLARRQVADPARRFLRELLPRDP